MDIPIRLLARCEICESNCGRLIASLRVGERQYDEWRCAACGTIQVLQQYELLSPEYVGLSDVSQERLWCQGDHKTPAFEQWLRLVSKHKETHGKKLLDVGCGTGGFLLHAIKYGLEPYGFDASAKQAEVARTMTSSVRCSQSVAEYSKSIGAERFDLITMWDVLEHQRKPVETCKELAASLAEGGLLFAAVPNASAMPWKARLRRGSSRALAWAPWEHVFYYTQEALFILMGKAGLDVIESGAVVAYPRKLSPYELARRAGFRLLANCPRLSPQIFVLCRRAQT